MELPIRVIVVLFVALIVGGVIIAFSQELITQSRDRVSELGLEDVSEDRVLELATIDSQDIQELAAQCVREMSGSFDETTCYAVFADEIAGLPADGASLPQDYSLSVEAEAGQDAIRIIHAPTQGLVIVR